MEHYIAAIDVGTTGAKAMIIGTDGSVAGQGYREYGAAYPRPGWVEQDSEEIVEKTFDACRAPWKRRPSTPPSSPAPVFPASGRRSASWTMKCG